MLRRLVVALVAAIAYLLSGCPGLFATATTTASAVISAYDDPSVARFGARYSEATNGGPTLLGDAQDQSASPSVEARGTSTTSVSRNHATNKVDDIIAIGPSGNPGAFPFSGSTGLTSRASAREALAGVSGATPEQIAAANRAIGRGTSTSTYNVGTFGERVVVQVQRPGANGYQVVETVVSPDGSKFVVQKAYDATGQLVHYDPKTP